MTSIQPPDVPAGTLVRRGESNRRSVARRVVSSVLVIPPCLALVHVGGWIFTFLVGGIVALATAEFVRLARLLDYRVSAFATITTAAALPIVAHRWGAEVELHVLGLFVVFSAASRVFRRRQDGVIADTGISLLGVLYVGVLSTYIVLLRDSTGESGSAVTMGAALVYLTLLVTWAHDTGAYTVGLVLGRHPMVPKISPAKTWEGAAGGLAFALLAALVARWWFAPFLTLSGAVLVGIVGAGAAVGGDLFASMIKRSANIKDTGRFLPGHGGLLDRLDSLLFTGPALFYLLHLFEPAR